MRHLPLILFLLVLPLVSGWQCASAPKRPVVPEIVKVAVPTPVALDPKLTADCLDEAAKSQLVEEAIRLANVRREYLNECTARMRQIRALQPAKP